MVPKSAILRVTRPTDNLNEITDMYVNGLGVRLLGSCEDHNGFDGSIIGHESHPYHLEFIHHRGSVVGSTPTQDSLLIFYMPQHEIFTQCCERIDKTGFIVVPADNDYWNLVSKTFEDLDGYRVVLQEKLWFQ